MNADALANIRKQLRDFVHIELLNNEYKLQDSDDLYAQGLIDSLGAMQLFTFVGDLVGEPCPEEDFIPENFGTFENLVAYVIGRLSQRVPSAI